MYTRRKESITYTEEVIYNKGGIKPSEAQIPEGARRLYKAHRVPITSIGRITGTGKTNIISTARKQIKRGRTISGEVPLILPKKRISQEFRLQIKLSIRAQELPQIRRSWLPDRQV